MTEEVAEMDSNALPDRDASRPHAVHRLEPRRRSPLDRAVQLQSVSLQELEHTVLKFTGAVQIVSRAPDQILNSETSARALVEDAPNRLGDTTVSQILERFAPENGSWPSF